MSGAGTQRPPRLRFCWVCSRRLQGNFHRVAVVDGRDVIVHAACALAEGLTIKAGANLANADGSGGGHQRGSEDAPRAGTSAPEADYQGTAP